MKNRIIESFTIGGVKNGKIIPRDKVIVNYSDGTSEMVARSVYEESEARERAAYLAKIEARDRAKIDLYLDECTIESATADGVAVPPGSEARAYSHELDVTLVACTYTHRAIREDTVRLFKGRAVTKHRVLSWCGRHNNLPKEVTTKIYPA